MLSLGVLTTTPKFMTPQILRHKHNGKVTLQRQAGCVEVLQDALIYTHINTNWVVDYI